MKLKTLNIIFDSGLEKQYLINSEDCNSQEEYNEAVRKVQEFMEVMFKSGQPGYLTFKTPEGIDITLNKEKLAGVEFK